jgi:hypothetical protein
MRPLLPQSTETLEGRNPSASWRRYILRMVDKLIWTRQLDRNSGRCLLAAPGKGSDRNLWSESCSSASPSRVQDACGFHAGNEHTLRAIASDGVHSPRRCGPASLFGCLRPNAPPHRWPGTLEGGAPCDRRQMIEDDPNRPVYIKSVHAFGYTFRTDKKGYQATEDTGRLEGSKLWKRLAATRPTGCVTLCGQSQRVTRRPRIAVRS